MQVTIVGKGRVGKSLTHALRRSAVPTTLTSGRNPRRRALGSATVVVLAVPDGAISSTASRIAPMLDPGTVVLHCAGALGPDELAACSRAGMAVGAMHPLASMPDPGTPADLRGTTLTLSGDQAAVDAGRRVARSIGAHGLVAPLHGGAYHAAAALVANGAASLAHAGVGVLEHLGASRRDAERAVAALLRTVADNVERIGVPEALSGPIRRGDAGTVRAHRRALGEVSRSALLAYDGVAPAVLSCAVESGLEKRAAHAVARELRAEP